MIYPLFSAPFPKPNLTSRSPTHSILHQFLVPGDRPRPNCNEYSVKWILNMDLRDQWGWSMRINKHKGLPFFFLLSLVSKLVLAMEVQPCS